MLTRIGFVRHGTTDWNTERRAQGQSDIPLNAAGRLQAHALSERLKNERWDLIFSSDLSRAKETADIAAAALGLTVHTDPRLREIHKGEIEGTTLEERVTRWGEHWERMPLGIEDEQSAAARGTSFIAEMAEAFRGKSILAVSHGALIGLTVKRLIASVNIEVHFHNTSITTIHHNGIEWECGLLNCAEHLA